MLLLQSVRTSSIPIYPPITFPLVSSGFWDSARGNPVGALSLIGYVYVILRIVLTSVCNVHPHPLW